MAIDVNAEMGRRFFEAQDRLRGGPITICVRQAMWRTSAVIPR